MIKVISQTQRVVIDPATQSVSVINSGPPGPAGVPGPSEASLILDTDGQLLTRASGELAPITRVALAEDNAFKTVVNHGAVASTARTSSHPILWIGSVDPTNAANNDELYRTDRTAKYVRVSGSWVEIGSNRFVYGTRGSGAPGGTGTDGEWYYDTVANRAYLSDGGGWVIMSEPKQDWNTSAAWGGITGGTPSYVGDYHRNDGYCDFRAAIIFGSAPSSISNLTFVLPFTAGYVPAGALSIMYFDSGIAYFGGYHGAALNTAVLGLAVWYTGGTYLSGAGVTSTVPLAFNNADAIEVSGRFRMASRYS